MMKSRSKLIAYGASFLFVALFAIVIRIYPLILPLWDETFPPQNQAKQIVLRAMAEQIKPSLDLQFPQMNESEKRKLAQEKANEIATADKVHFEEAVQKAAAGLKKYSAQKTKRKYLLEADSYYYLNLTENVKETGHVSSQIGGGQYVNSLMNAPVGYRTVFSLHPYLGYAWYGALHFFNPNITVMEAAHFYPLVCTVLIVMIFFWTAWTLKMGTVPTFFGAMTLILSPIFIQRSAFGWFDTDPYNFLFPILVFGVMFNTLYSRSPILIGALLSAFLTGLYSYFWVGWPVLFILISGGIFAVFICFWSLVRFRQAPETMRAFRFFISYFVAALGFALLFITPEGLRQALQGGWETLEKFALTEFDVWPNAFLTVGESNAVSIKKIIFLTSNYISLFVVILGVLVAPWLAWKENKLQNLFSVLFFIFISIPLLFMSLRTERFSLLLVIPIAFLAMFGVKTLKTFSDKVLMLKFPKLSCGMRALFFGAPFAILYLPLPVVTAHVVASGIQPIMNDTWYDFLKEVNKRTPESSIINSWWPPGHFIKAIAKRRVTLDGATQHLKSTYWISKAFISSNERQSAGLLRMLNLSSTKAYDYLESLEVDPVDSVDLILNIVALSRESAKTHLLKRFTQEQTHALLDLTHGSLNDLFPTYVFLYNDMMDQNLAMTLMSEWDFKKAKEMQTRPKEVNQVLVKKTYLENVMSIVGGVLKYLPEPKLTKKEKGVLYFSNGLKIDLATHEASMWNPEKGILNKKLISLFYLEGDKLIEKKFDGDRFDVSALIFEEKGTYRAIVADPRLIRSTFFRLYYLEGKGLALFRPVLNVHDDATQTTLMLFEMNREKLYQE